MLAGFGLGGSNKGVAPSSTNPSLPAAVRSDGLDDEGARGLISERDCADLGGMETDLPTIAKQLRALDKSDIRNWLKRGELLTQAKALAPNDTAFWKWTQRQGIARRTAFKAIAAWRDFGTVPTSASFSIEAMAVLGASPEAREEAIGLSGSKRVTTRIARELVAKHLPLTPAERPTLARTQADGYFETFTVDGFTFTVAGPGNPTASDLLGLVANIQRTLRERILRAA